MSDYRKKNNISLNTLSFHNCDEQTAPSKCDSSGYYKAHDDSKLKIFKKGLAYFTFEYQLSTS